MFTSPHLSCVTCHVSHVTCQVSLSSYYFPPYITQTYIYHQLPPFSPDDLEVFCVSLSSTGAWISLIKQVCRRRKIKDSLPYVWKHVTDWSICINFTFQNIFLYVSKYNFSRLGHWTTYNVLGLSRLGLLSEWEGRALMRIAPSASRRHTELQKEPNWTYYELYLWALTHKVWRNMLEQTSNS